ncbi:MAG: hypothetical protein ABJA76_13785, partial [Mucilaginibacter sp.]
AGFIRFVAAGVTIACANNFTRPSIENLTIYLTEIFTVFEILGDELPNCNIYSPASTFHNICRHSKCRQ